HREVKGRGRRRSRRTPNARGRTARRRRWMPTRTGSCRPVPVPDAADPLPLACTGAARHPPAMQPTLRDLFAARLRIGGIAYRTPLERSDWLSELAGCDVYLKLECWQRTRSFKIRGAYNAIASLPAELRGRG